MIVILPESGIYSERIINTDFIVKTFISETDNGDKIANIVFSGPINNTVIDMNQYSILKEYIIQSQTK